MPSESPQPKTALITGANRGIGRASTLQLAAAGWHVIATARSSSVSQLSADEAIASHPHIHCLALDTSNPDSIAAAVENLQAKIPSLHLLINNAGIFLDHEESILTVDETKILDSFTTNTLGPIRLTRALVPLLQAAPEALVINLSSAAGSLTEMKDWSPAYSISKTALNAATRQLAAALAPQGITVCAVSPGWVRTDMGGPKAPRSAEQAAESILQLLSKPRAELTGRFLRDAQDHPW